MVRSTRLPYRALVDGGAGMIGDRIERRILWLVAAAFAIAGIALRCWRALSDPLWLDEAYSAFAAAHDFRFLWTVVPRYETHPPLYYTLLHCWTSAFGDSLPALRAPGLIAGLCVPPALAWSADAAGRLLDWGDRRRTRLAFTAFALACLSTPLIEMAREVRPYPLMILAYALAARALLALAARRRAGLGLASKAYAAYAVLVALLLWLHNLGLLWAAALGIALPVVFAGRGLSRLDWLWLVGGHGLIGLVYLPALLILLDQAPTWVATTWLGFSWAALWPHLAILYAVPGWQAIVAAALLLPALGALARARGEARRLGAMLLALAIVPVLLSIGITLTIAPVFITRTMTPVAVPALLLLSIGAVAWRGWRGWAGWIAAGMLAANLLAVDLQARARGPMQDWYGTIAWLRKRFRPGDQIYAYPNEAALPMARALRDKRLAWPIRAIPAQVPAFGQGGWHPTGSRGVVSLPPERLHAIASDPAARAVPTIWLLRLGAETYDRGDVFRAELSHGRHMVRRWRDGPIDVIGLRAIRPPPAPD